MENNNNNTNELVRETVIVSEDEKIENAVAEIFGNKAVEAESEVVKLTPSATMVEESFEEVESTVINPTTNVSSSTVEENKEVSPTANPNVDTMGQEINTMGTVNATDTLNQVDEIKIEVNPTSNDTISITDELLYSDDTPVESSDDKKGEADIPYKNPIVIEQNIPLNQLGLDEIAKSPFFGKTPFQENSTKSPTSTMDVLNLWKKMGEFIDGYLPMSNIVVRIYEFENDLFISDVLPYIYEDALLEEVVDNANIEGTEVTHDRLLINKIFENMKILSRDSENLTPIDYGKLSNVDMKILLLMAAKLILTSDPDIKDRDSVYMDTACEKCGRAMKIQVKVDELLKAQYNKFAIENAINNYNPDLSFEENFNKSPHMKSRKNGGIKFKVNDEYFIGLSMSDPNYEEAVEKESRALRYLIRKYEGLPIVKSLIDTNDYRMKSFKNKYRDLVETINNDPNGMTYVNQIRNDIRCLYAIMYTNAISTVKNKTDKEPAKIVEKLIINNPNDDEVMEKAFMQLTNLPRQFKDKIQKYVNKLHESALRANIKYSFKCHNPKCGHITDHVLDSRAFVFSVLQIRSESQNQEDSQD